MAWETIFAARSIAAALALTVLVQSPPSAAQDGSASTAACPDRIPKITVVADIGEFAYDHSRSIPEIHAIEAGSQPAAGHVLGLTRQDFAMGGETMKPLILPQEDGSICVGYTDGTMVLRLITTIFIVRELVPGSCLYDQVLAHEQRHAKVGRRLYTEFAAKLEAGIAKAFRKRPFIKVTDPAVAPAAAKARIQQIFDPIYRDFRSVYRKRQAIIDTTGEFARVEATCPGEMQRVIGQ